MYLCVSMCVYSNLHLLIYATAWCLCVGGRDDGAMKCSDGACLWRLWRAKISIVGNAFVVSCCTLKWIGKRKEEIANMLNFIAVKGRKREGWMVGGVKHAGELREMCGKDIGGNHVGTILNSKHLKNESKKFQVLGIIHPEMKNLYSPSCLSV